MKFNYSKVANALLVVSCILGTLGAYYFDTDLKMAVKMFAFAWVSSCAASVAFSWYVIKSKQGNENNSTQREHP